MKTAGAAARLIAFSPIIQTGVELLNIKSDTGDTKVDLGGYVKLDMRDVNGDGDNGKALSAVGVSGSNAEPDESIPDFVTRCNLKGNWGKMSFGILFCKVNRAGIDETAIAANVSGRNKTIGNDVFRYKASVGELGRYVAAKTPDIVTNTSDEVVVEDTTAFVVAYRHFWNESTRLTAFFGGAETDYFEPSASGSFFECTEDEVKKAYLHRFSAEGDAVRYQTIHEKEIGDILALDIALKNELNWVALFPPEIEQHLEKILSYGYFFCYVFHQDYILKKGSCAKEVIKRMLAQLYQYGAKYPAEHKVGHLYNADDNLTAIYHSLDPTNTFNPGTGKMEKSQRNCQCCL